MTASKTAAMFMLASIVVAPTMARGTTLAELQVACDKKKAEACNLLAKILVLLKDSRGARNAFKNGCDAGDGAACFALGEQLDERDNSANALAAYKKACQLGNRDGCGKVGRMLATGNKPGALGWLKKGCTGPDDLPLTCVVLSRELWAKGEKDQAREAARYACASNSEHRAFGCGELSWIHMNWGTAFAAPEIALIACLGGDMNGSNNRGSMYLNERQYGDSIKYFRKACNGGIVEGCHGLGVALDYTGDKAGAEAAIRKACQGGSAGGCANLASIMRSKGKIAEAKKLYQKACKAGDGDSCRRLRENFQ